MASLNSLKLRDKVMAVVGLPLLVGVAASVLYFWSLFGEARVLKSGGKLAIAASSLAHDLQKERGMSAGFLGSAGSKFKDDLKLQRAQVEQRSASLRSLKPEERSTSYGAGYSAHQAELRNRLSLLDGVRSQVDSLSLPPAQLVDFYSATISAALGMISEIARASRSTENAKLLSAYANFLQAKERAGMERAVLTNTFAADAFGQGMFTRFIELVAAQDAYIASFLAVAPPKVQLFYREKSASDSSFERAGRIRDIARQKAAEGKFGVEAGEWFKVQTAKIDALKEIEDFCAAELEKQLSAMERRVWRMSLFLVLGIGAIAMLSLAVVRSVTGPIDNVISELHQASEHVARASAEVAKSSEALAQGASEQASSLEETSAAIEEITSVAAHAKDNAQAASALTKSTEGLTGRGNESMSRLAQTMHEIRRSSDETANIIKIIDEIAFQTNLLALNAAVEAARAGEAGRGFAVVAEEVRSLAQRSANAARETTEKIDSSLDLGRQGVSAADLAASSFDEIRASSTKAADLVREISEASVEQAKGISEINTAVNELDQVTQGNAAAAEQAAAASGELLNQVKNMDRIVKTLSGLVHGEHA